MDGSARDESGMVRKKVGSNAEVTKVLFLELKNVRPKMSVEGEILNFKTVSSII